MLDDMFFFGGEEITKMTQVFMTCVFTVCYLPTLFADLVVSVAVWVLSVFHYRTPMPVTRWGTASLNNAKQASQC